MYRLSILDEHTCTAGEPLAYCETLPQVIEAAKAQFSGKIEEVELPENGEGIVTIIFKNFDEFLVLDKVNGPIYTYKR